MSAKRPSNSEGAALRLVSDAGRTVADPPLPPHEPSAQPESPSQAQPVEQTSASQAQPPAHPSMTGATAHGDDVPANVGHDHGHDNADADSDAQPLAEAVPASRGTAARTLDDNDLYAAVEAVLLVAVEPVPAEVLASVTAAPLAAVKTACEELAREYARDERGFLLARVGGGYQIRTAATTAEYVERFVGGRRSARLSAAATETLAVVAYKQPISRARISAIRGVNADGVVRTLVDQGYIAEVARDPGPGHAALLATTPAFLERLGLDSLDDLPSLAALTPDTDALEAIDRLAVERSG